MRQLKVNTQSHTKGRRGRPTFEHPESKNYIIAQPPRQRLKCYNWNATQALMSAVTNLNRHYASSMSNALRCPLRGSRRCRRSRNDDEKKRHFSIRSRVSGGRSLVAALLIAEQSKAKQARHFWTKRVDLGDGCFGFKISGLNRSDDEIREARMFLVRWETDYDEWAVRSRTRRERSSLFFFFFFWSIIEFIQSTD
jgi:hypothetical protein